MECVGFKMEFPKYTITYSADTSYSHKLIESYKDTDILILNVKSYKREDNNEKKELKREEIKVKDIDGKELILKMWPIRSI